MVLVIEGSRMGMEKVPAVVKEVLPLWMAEEEEAMAAKAVTVRVITIGNPMALVVALMEARLQ